MSHDNYAELDLAQARKIFTTVAAQYPGVEASRSYLIAHIQVALREARNEGIRMALHVKKVTDETQG